MAQAQVTVPGTGTPLAGAKVYSNGAFVGVTDQNGFVTVPDMAATPQVMVAAAGYQPFPLTYNAGLWQGSPSVSAGSKVATSLPLSLAGGPVSQASYTITPTDGGAPVTGTFLPDGTATASVAPGDYNATVSAPGFNPTSAKLTAGAGSAALPLTQSSDPESSAAATSPLQTPSIPASSPVTSFVSLPGPEFVPPQANFGRYFMSPDVRMYIGDVFIDELAFVQFTGQDNKIPIYSYGGRYMAAVGQGRSLIQGQLGVNFISEGYLYTVLQNYFDNFFQTSLSPQQQELNSLVVLQTQASGQGNFASLNASGTPADVSQRIQDLVQSLGTDALTLAKEYANRTALTSFDTGTKAYANAIYQGGPFNIEIDLSGGNRTAIRLLEDCFLVSNDMAIAPDGKTIIDCYGFVARRVR